jgi:glycosyltransferase involved in cell wall biosynthesis
MLDHDLTTTRLNSEQQSSVALTTQRQGLRVLSLATHMPISGVTAWNLRMTAHFREAAELGIDWQVAEFIRYVPEDATRPDVPKIMASLPVTVRDRWQILPPFPAGGNAWGPVVEWVAAHPEWRDLDVLLVDSCNMECYLIALELERRYGRRPAVVSIIHNDHESHYCKSWQTLAPGVEAVWCVSREAQRRFAETNPTAPPAEHLRYPVPMPSEPPAKPLAGPLRICWTGRIETKQKRVLDLVTLVEQLCARHVPFELHILGDGSVADELRAKMAPYEGREVFLHGTVPGAEVAGRLRDMHVFVNVSEFEGTSVSMLEAMGQALVPVVTEVRSGAPDVIVSGQNGWLVPIGDMSAMADRIAQLAADRASTIATGQRAWSAVRDLYGTDASAGHLAELLTAAAERPRPKLRLLPTPYLTRLDRRWLPNEFVVSLRTLRRRFKNWLPFNMLGLGSRGS